MKKILSLIVAMLVTFAFLSACTPSETPSISECENVITDGRILASGEQTLTITSVQPDGNGEKARFKNNIDITDITLDGAIYGKTLMAVVFENEHTIKLMFSGDCVPFDGIKGKTQLRISKNALHNGYDSVCEFTVYKQQMLAQECIFDITGGKVTTKFVLPWGSFTDKATADAISLLDPTIGEISEVEVVDDGNALVVTVSEFYGTLAQLPTITIASDATTFGVVITISMQTDSTCDLY